MSLHLYRRHRTGCSHRSLTYKRCQCPIYVRGTLGGVTVPRMGLDQTSWDAASKIVAGWLEAGTVGAVSDQSKTVIDAVSAFLTDCDSRHLAPETIKKYKLLLQRRLVPWSIDHGYPVLKSLDVDAMSRFRGTWLGGALSKSKTQERLKYFFRWCVKRGWTTVNPGDGLSAIKVVKNPTLPFTSEEVGRIADACDRCSNKGIYGDGNRARMKAFILVLRWTGLRIRDVSTLTRERVGDNSVFLYTQKTGTPVWLPVPKSVTDALAAVPVIHDQYYFWTGEGQPESVVSNWQRALRELFAKAKIDKGHAHRFRDTFAVELLLKGVDLTDVSILLGHSSIKITESHYSPWVATRQTRLAASVRGTWQAESAPGSVVSGTPAQPPIAESGLLVAQ